MPDTLVKMNNIAFLIFYLPYLTSIGMCLIFPVIFKYIVPDSFTVKTKNKYDLAHQLISYGFSTIHGLTLASVSYLYIVGILSANAVYFAFDMSIGYFIADFVYIILTSKSFKNIVENNENLLWIPNLVNFIKYDLPFLLHHFIVIYYLNYTITAEGEMRDISIKYFTRVMMAEFAVLPLNTLWWYRNCVQDYKYKMGYFLTKAMLVMVYFMTRVLNFSLIVWDLWWMGLFPVAMAGIPIVVLNYLWFWKICLMVLKN